MSEVLGSSFKRWNLAVWDVGRELGRCPPGRELVTESELRVWRTQWMLRKKGEMRWDKRGQAYPLLLSPNSNPTFPFLGVEGGNTGSLYPMQFFKLTLCPSMTECLFLNSPSPMLVYRLVHIHVCGIQPRALCMLSKHSVYLPSYTVAVFSIFLLRKGLFELSKLALNSLLALEGLELEILPPLVPK